MTNDQVQPRILVIDNEERVREDLHAMFTPLGYDVRVATGSGPALQENAKSLAGKFRPHVAIVDMRLLLDDDPNDRSGVQLLEELEPAHCILYSAYITPEISRKLADFRTAGWTGKEEPPQMLVDLVNRVARESSATQKNFQIEKNSVIFEQESRALLGRDTEIPSSLIEDILCQVFHDANGVKVEKITGAVKTPMSVNRERSLILKTARRDKLEPFIVKIAKKKNILQESKNYQEYIEGNLKGRFYANLIGRPISFWDLGALVYTFLGSSEQNVVFSAFYQREEDENKILKPLQAFWGEVWRGLYEKTKDIETSLYSSYNESLKLEERLTKFPDQTEHRAYRGIDINMPNPITWVLRHKTDNSVLNARQAITHGDLHGDNIFVDDSHAWVIDFERSGWGHILRDFTELEVDILTRLAWKKDDKDLKEFFRLLTYLADPYYFGKDFESIGQFNNKELRKAFNVIKGLRALAKDITKFNDFREYSWSLLFDTIFVATHTEEEEHQQERALLYGSVLCSCLQHWGLKWPPTNWLSLTNNQANQLNKLDMPKKETRHEFLNSDENESKKQETGKSVMNIYFGGNLDGNLIIGDSNQIIKDSYNKITSAKIAPELKETLKLLTEAVATMNTALPKDQAAEAAEDLSRLVDEVTKPAPNKKWYSVSIDGLIKAAENVERVGEPVINLTRKVLSLLTAGLVSP